MENSSLQIKAQNVIAELEWPDNGLGLSYLFNGQRKFLDELIRTKGLGKYPSEINTKEGQSLIRDMGTRFTEELSESFNPILKILKLKGEAPVVEHKALLEEYLYELNEELSDCLHFLINLCLYCNFDPETLFDEINVNLMNPDGYNPYVYQVDPDTDLEDILNYARLLNVSSGTKNSQSLRIGDAFIYAGRSITQDDFGELIKLYWFTNHAMFETLNLLKLRYWRKSEVETSSKLFSHKLLFTFITFMRILVYLGHDSTSILRIYQVKNHINWIRLIK